MSTVMKISPQGQVRIPNRIMVKLGLGKGDYVEMEIVENQIVLKPRKLIDPSQGYYWTREWQEMESTVDDEMESGQVSPVFGTAEEGLQWLKK
jgi:AbrB family looped-hinge helix DNA binding protein